MLPLVIILSTTATNSKKACSKAGQSCIWNVKTFPLILGNLRDCTHRALLEAFAASDASVFVHNFGDTAGNFQNFLRASVDANATTDALVSINQGTCHSELLF